MTSDLVTWLRGCLDEDERRARAASLDEAWTSTDGEYEGEPLLIYGDFGWLVRGPAGTPEFEDSEQGKADALFVATWNPTRVLAEVAAKRRILDDCLAYTGVHMDGYREPSAPAFWRILLALAGPYAGREGFREEWAL